MEVTKIRKFNTEFRKKLITRFDKIKDKIDYILIYYIIVKDIGNNFSSNRNGLFFNINLLSDSCIEKLIEFVNEKTNSHYIKGINQENNNKKLECV